MQIFKDNINYLTAASGGVVGAFQIVVSVVNLYKACFKLKTLLSILQALEVNNPYTL